MASTINQTNICGVHLGLLPQTSPSGCRLWVVSVSILISSNLARLLVLRDVHVQFQKEYVLKFYILPFLTCLGFMLAYSIPVRYVHKYGSNLGNSDL